ncbi:MAG: GNAT family N-acetyltransferase [Candidatus Paceibacterota bacterium]|jgi:ribosomal protein S18 acetylase RimI-like enzyme
MIKYKTIKKLPPKRLYELYELVGWVNGVKDKKKHGYLISIAYNNSSTVFSAWNDKELIGIIRVVSDNTTHAYIVGLVVDEAYQEQGIGEELLKKCIKKYSKMRINAETEKPVKSLYKKLGFKKSPTENLLIGNYVI